MQAILGGNGVIGIQLARNLTQFTNRIRIVSRTPRKVNQNDETVSADLSDGEQTEKAVQGAAVAYLTAGLPYKREIWETRWPLIMRNVINACARQNVKLVFFDNVYLYGRVKGWMTEDTPVNPVSKKGEVRATIAETLMNETRKGNLKAMIARSADFYGPFTPLSFVNVMVFENLRKGRKAQWLLNDQVRHSFTYTPDAGRATAILGNTEKAYNQVWHLPSDPNALTGKQFIGLAAEAFGAEAGYMTLKEWMLKVIGVFNGTVRESIEMLYQSDSDYLFDSSKFAKEFNFRTTPYREGIAETVKSMR